MPSAEFSTVTTSALSWQPRSSFFEATSMPQNKPLDSELVVLESFMVGDPSLQIRALGPKRLFGLNTSATGDPASKRCLRHPGDNDLPVAIFCFAPMGAKQNSLLLQTENTT